MDMYLPVKWCIIIFALAPRDARAPFAPPGYAGEVCVTLFERVMPMLY